MDTNKIRNEGTKRRQNNRRWTSRRARLWRASCRLTRMGLCDTKQRSLVSRIAGNQFSLGWSEAEAWDRISKRRLALKAWKRVIGTGGRAFLAEHPVEQCASDALSALNAFFNANPGLAGSPWATNMPPLRGFTRLRSV